MTPGTREWLHLRLLEGFDFGQFKYDSKNQNKTDICLF